MCIIVVKKKGEKMPKKSILQQCFSNNNDGAGFMFSDSERVYIKKGFFNFKTFYKSLKSAVGKVGEDAPFILHFRITTQGGIRADCCHPYPIADNIKALRKLNTTTSIGVAHNGIIPITSTHESKVDYNDTMQFIVEYLSLIIHDKSDLFIEDNIKLINRLSCSKLAFLTSDGTIKLTGDGWIEDDGIYYSNNSYQKISKNWYYDNNIYEDWNEYKDVNNYYNFNEYYCPYSENGDYTYCSKCNNYTLCYCEEEVDEENKK